MKTKDYVLIGIVLIALLGVGYFGYTLKKCPPKGKVLVEESVWDSLTAYHEPHVDTLWLKPDTIYIPSPQPPIPHPQPNPIDTTINFYADSLVNKDINVWANYTVRGTLLDRSWRYNPIVMQITKDSLIYVVETKEVPVIVKNSYFLLYGVGGGNGNSFLFGGGLDYVTRNGLQMGYMFQRYGKENFHSLKLGVQLRWPRQK